MLWPPLKTNTGPLAEHELNKDKNTVTLSILPLKLRTVFGIENVQINTCWMDEYE